MRVRFCAAEVFPKRAVVRSLRLPYLLFAFTVFIRLRLFRTL